MQYNVVDRSNNPLTVIVQGLDPVTDHSGQIAATGTSQPLLQANAARSGFLIQNRSTTGNAMVVNEMGNDAIAFASWLLNPGDTFPPPGYPVQIGPVTIAGNIGDAYTCREW